MKWYQEKTFKWALTVITVIAILFTVAIWIIDKEFPLEALYFFGAAYLILISGQYIFRNNP